MKPLERPRGTEQPRGANEPQRVNELQAWISDDCVVKECIDGNIFSEVNGYSTVFNCPRCMRTKITPGQRIWSGKITIRSESEMAERQLERRELVFGRTERYDRAKELARLLHDICAPKDEKKGDLIGNEIRRTGPGDDDVPKEEEPF